MTPKNGSEFVGEFASTSEEITYTYQKAYGESVQPKETPKNGSEFVGEFASTYMYEEITYTFFVHMARDATRQGFHTN